MFVSGTILSRNRKVRVEENPGNHPCPETILLVQRTGKLPAIGPIRAAQRLAQRSHSTVDRGWFAQINPLGFAMLAQDISHITGLAECFGGPGGFRVERTPLTFGEINCN